MSRELDDIVVRISRSDRAAFGQLYRMFYPLLVNYATLMVSRVVAKDIVQDVFFKLWQGRKGLLPESSGGQHTQFPAQEHLQCGNQCHKTQSFRSQSPVECGQGSRGILFRI